MVDHCKLIVDEDSHFANNFRGHDGTIGFNMHYFRPIHDDLQSKQISSVLDAFSPGHICLLKQKEAYSAVSSRRIDALQV